MINEKIIKIAVDIAINYYESNHYISDTPSIERRVLTWYNMSDITDPSLLAAAAIYYGEWFAGATLDDMEYAFDMIF